MFSFDLEEVLVVVDNSAECSSPMAADEAMNGTYRNWNPRFNFRCNWGNFKGGRMHCGKNEGEKVANIRIAPVLIGKLKPIASRRISVKWEISFYFFQVHFFPDSLIKSSFLINTKSCSILLNIQYTVSTKTLTDHFPKEWSLLFKHTHTPKLLKTRQTH